MVIGLRALLPTISGPSSPVSPTETNAYYSPGGESFSAQSATTLTTITWAEELTPFFSTFKERLEESQQQHLAIRITQHSFKYGGNRAGLGWVEGVIGIPSADDTLCVPGQRMMHPVKGSKPDGLDYDICEQCIYKGQDRNQGKTWLGPTPFKVEIESEGTTAHVSVDFSSTVVVDNSRNIRDIKKLELTVCDDDKSDCSYIIGELKDYKKETTYTVKSGI